MAEEAAGTRIDEMSHPTGALRITPPREYDGAAAGCTGFLLQLDLYLATVRPGSLGRGELLLQGEVAQLQEEVHLLRQMKDISKDLEEGQGGCSADMLSATELRVQLAQKEQELDHAQEVLQAMKADPKHLKAEKAYLVNQMQQLYATLESREKQLRDFIHNYEQHRKESEDAVKALAKEKDLLEREKWDLRRQTKESTEYAGALRSQLDLNENRIKELEAELAMVRTHTYSGSSFKSDELMP
ncbi:kazrin-like [Oncorhynchus kisutch]|uniref:kazrin-like n=1 Tax=Oncorhynchus kisutch TaxID=8019 RepID=UPI0012DD4730|nr:kazrin-like [Oncorhynchus kisutch]